MGVTVMAFVLFSLLHAVVNDAKDKPITIAVRPRVAFAPADLSILIHLIPAESDRFLRVWTDGLDYGRSSEWSLEGAQSPKLYTVTWPRVFPAAEYDITASVSDALHVIRGSAVQRVVLTSP